MKDNDGLIHLEQMSGRTAGRPWCRSDPSVAAADAMEAVMTRDEEQITCRLCQGFVDRCRESADRSEGLAPLTGPQSKVDWFGEDQPGEMEQKP